MLLNDRITNKSKSGEYHLSVKLWKFAALFGEISHATYALGDKFLQFIFMNVSLSLSLALSLFLSQCHSLALPSITLSCCSSTMPSVLQWAQFYWTIFKDGADLMNFNDLEDMEKKNFTLLTPKRANLKQPTSKRSNIESVILMISTSKYKELVATLR